MTKSSKPLQPDPVRQFDLWFQEAKKRSEIQLPEAACLSTVAPGGEPDGRMILLKGHDKNGFVFYTNLDSPKAKALHQNPKAALTFYWEDFRRQIRISGTVEKQTEKEADAYFVSRPRLSQIAAWTSRQSAPLASRQILEKEFADMGKKFEGQNIPRPPFWGGYRLIPNKIEFWEEKPNRLHDRVLYTKKKEAWEMVRLYP